MHGRVLGTPATPWRIAAGDRARPTPTRRSSCRHRHGRRRWAGPRRPRCTAGAALLRERAAVRAEATGTRRAGAAERPRPHGGAAGVRRLEPHSPAARSEPRSSARPGMAAAALGAGVQRRRLVVDAAHRRPGGADDRVHHGPLAAVGVMRGGLSLAPRPPRIYGADTTTAAGPPRRLTRRARRLVRSMPRYPDAIELVVLAVRAGHLPLAAIARRCTATCRGRLRDAFAAVLAASRRRLQRFADALPSCSRSTRPGASTLWPTAFAAADRDGLPLAPVLDRLAAEARQHRRRQRRHARPPTSRPPLPAAGAVHAAVVRAARRRPLAARSPRLAPTAEPRDPLDLRHPPTSRPPREGPHHERTTSHACTPGTSGAPPAHWHDDDGQATTEYALVLLGAALVALLRRRLGHRPAAAPARSAACSTVSSTRSSTSCDRPPRRDRGQATVELALALPLLCVLLLAVVQVAVVARDQLAVQLAAREAARAASVVGDQRRWRTVAALRAVALRPLAGRRSPRRRHGHAPPSPTPTPPTCRSSVRCCPTSWSPPRSPWPSSHHGRRPAG